MRRVLGAALLAVLVPSSVLAIQWVGHAYAPACNRHYVFARDIYAPDTDWMLYNAADCETVFVDRHVLVVLPRLTGVTAPQRIVVRNIGQDTSYVASMFTNAGLESRINPVLTGYTPTVPQVPIWSGGDQPIIVLPGQTVTFIAMPSKLAKAWFTE